MALWLSLSKRWCQRHGVGSVRWGIRLGTGVAGVLGHQQGMALWCGRMGQW